MEYRNAAYNQHGTIDLEFNHPAYGWIPFTASPHDTEKLGRDLYALALKGEVAPYVEPEPEPPTVSEYKAAIVAHLDAAAQARLYDGAVSIATYVNSTNPAWAAEATAFVAWRDAVWAYAYTELDKVMAGTRAQPTVAEILAELPAIQWPA